MCLGRHQCQPPWRRAQMCLSTLQTSHHCSTVPVPGSSKRASEVSQLCLVWWRSVVPITAHRICIQLLNYIAFICFSKETRLMQSCWVCACPSIRPSHSNSWASCLALIKAGRRSETSTTSSSASHWEAKHLVWGKSDLMACPTKKKAGSPGSPLDSKGSSMSHKTRRNQKLCQSCSLQEWLWAEASYKAVS